MEKLYIRTAGLTAEAYYKDGKLIIRKGSQARMELRPSFPKTQQINRDEMVKVGILKEVGDHLIFTKDYPCKSPSEGSNIITGISSNGMLIWKNNDGRTLRSLVDKGMI